MKELMSQARNITAVPKANGVQPFVEIILTVSEPRYALDEVGDSIRLRSTESFRYGTTPEGLRQHAKYLLACADEAEKVIAEACRHEADRPTGTPLESRT